jgi:hypothetical protein
MAELTIEDMLDILCEYTISFERFPHNYLADAFEEIPTIDGLAIDDKKQIIVNKELCNEEKKKTLLHELYHCYHYMKGDLYGLGMKKEEAVVHRETNEHFKKLYRK